MANGTNPLDDVDQLARFLQGNGFIGPIDLDGKTKKKATVVDTTKKDSLPEGGTADLIRMIQSFSKGAVDVGRAVKNRIGERVDMARQKQISGSDTTRTRTEKPEARSRSETHIPEMLRRPPQSNSIIDSINEKVLGGNRSVSGEPSGRGETMPSDPVTRALLDDSSISRVSEKEFAQGRNTLEKFLSNADFEGAKIEGTTPRGMPEAEELSGFGKAIRDFGKAAETPGFLKFLSQMGIAFSGGHPNEPGTILGQHNIDTIEGQAEAEIMERLLAGEDLSDIDMVKLGASSENVRNAVGMAQQQQKLDIEEKDTESQVDTREERLKLMGQELGLREEQIDINRFDAITRRMQAVGAIQDADVENLQSFELGMAADIVASEFLQTAMQNLRGGSSIEDIAKLQEQLQGPEGEIDPTKIRANLTEQQKAVFDSMLPRVANSLARSGSDVRGEGGFDAPTSRRDFISKAMGKSITRIRTKQERTAIEDGQLYEDNNGAIWMKQEGEDIRVF